MYATMRYYAGQGGDFVDALVEHENDVRAILKDIDGFRAYYLIRTADGDAVSVTVYDDQSGAEASNRAAAQWVAENLSNLSISPPQVSAGEVAISA